MIRQLTDTDANLVGLAQVRVASVLRDVTASCTGPLAVQLAVTVELDDHHAHHVVLERVP